MKRDGTHKNDRRSQTIVSRRALLAGSSTLFISGLAGCSGTSDSSSSTNGTGSTSSAAPSADSVFKSVNFDGPDLVVKLKSDSNVNQLNLIAPDGSTYKQTSVSAGATTARLQILFKSGGSYSPGTYKLVAATGKSSESTSLNLSPDIKITDVKPQVSKDNSESTGRLLVSVKNTGSGPTWIYNIGFKNAPYANAPQVIDGVADTQFERPKNPKDEFLDPDTDRVFLKKRAVLRVSDNDTVTCRSGTTELTVVVQTPHGNVKQRIRAHLSGGYNVQDSAAVQHPCKNVKIELVGGGTTNA